MKKKKNSNLFTKSLLDKISNLWYNRYREKERTKQTKNVVNLVHKFLKKDLQKIH
jgi:hypothetical protein